MIIRSCVSRRTATSPSCALINTTATARPFHAAAGRNAEVANHYETLEVSTSATAAEIKRSFYKLSKANHPDLHPNDKAKSQRFVKVSEAYATLGSAEKKQRYDRDFLRVQQSAGSSNPAYTPHGSHSSAQSGPGGRPASGLSRRRTQFRGPPPSFYRSGGWGEQGAKRKEHAEKASHSHEAQGQAASGPAGPGMGPGGFSMGWDHDVPHFNHEVHHKTHSTIERTRHRSRRKQGANFADREGGGSSALFNFFVIGGMLLGIAGLSGIVAGASGSVSKAKTTDNDK